MVILYARDEEAEFMFKLFGLNRRDLFLGRISLTQTKRELAKKFDELQNNRKACADNQVEHPYRVNYPDTFSKLEILLDQAKDKQFRPSWLITMGKEGYYYLKSEQSGEVNAYYLNWFYTMPCGW
tara:strand:- start:38 stop:412 length:375 start_codon:yes stop_codon:yes gene_type:complete